MKRLLPILLVSFLVFGIVQFNGARAQSGAVCDSSCVVNTTRTIWTTAWGTTITNDTITLVSAAHPIDHMSVGYPAGVASRVRNATAVDGSGRTLVLAKTIDTDFTLFNVTLPMGTSSGYTFTVRTAFTGLLRFNTASSQFNFTFSPFPVTDFNVTQANLSVITSGWSNPVASKLNGTFTGGVFSAQSSNRLALNTTVANIVFTSASQNLFDATLDRTLTISASGGVRATENYNITNRGPTLPTVGFVLPKDVSSVSAVDAIGPLDPSNLAPGGQSSTNSTWKVTPRYGSVITNQSLVITIEYNLSGSIVSSTGPGSYGLNYNLLSNVLFYQDTLVTRIVTPAGFRQVSLTSSISPVVSGNQWTGDQYVFDVAPVSPGVNVPISMSYMLSPFWASLSPLVWVVLLEVAVVFAVLVFQPGPTRAVLVGAGPMEWIKRLVDLYDEKSTLRQEADRIDEDMNRGAMNRHEYKRRRRLIDIRTGEIDRSLGPVRNQLSNSGARYQDMVRRVDRAEADLQVVRTSLADLRSQYRSGRMEKQLYESLASDLERRKVRDRQTIDNVIITLREEVR